VPAASAIEKIKAPFERIVKLDFIPALESEVEFILWLNFDETICTVGNERHTYLCIIRVFC
jgi:hypothetical protein